MSALAASFVPAADEVGRLQRGQDGECLLFQKIAEQGHYAGRTVPSKTRQGIYAATAGGTLLASVNTRNPRRVADMLERALARWEELGRKERKEGASPVESVRRWETRYPADGLVLRTSVRDIDRESGPADWRAEAWNQDFAWFTREEALAMLPESKTVGAEGVWPADLAARLARCHLVDAVRGQVPAFAREHVERARIETRVLSADSGTLELELSGSTRAVARGRWGVLNFKDLKEPSEQERGFETELLGRATFDRKQERFTRFELIAAGTRWGGTPFNARGDDLEPTPIGVSFSLTQGTPPERVAPALVWEYGWKPPGSGKSAGR